MKSIWFNIFSIFFFASVSTKAKETQTRRPSEHVSPPESDLSDANGKSKSTRMQLQATLFGGRKTVRATTPIHVSRTNIKILPRFPKLRLLRNPEVQRAKSYKTLRIASKVRTFKNVPRTQVSGDVLETPREPTQMFRGAEQNVRTAKKLRPTEVPRAQKLSGKFQVFWHQQFYQVLRLHARPILWIFGKLSNTRGERLPNATCVFAFVLSLHLCFDDATLLYGSEIKLKK